MTPSCNLKPRHARRASCARGEVAMLAGPSWVGDRKMRPWRALVLVACVAGCSGDGSSVQPMGPTSSSAADGAAEENALDDGHALDDVHALDGNGPDVDGDSVAPDAQSPDVGVDSGVACPSASPFSSESCPFTAASERLLCTYASDASAPSCSNTYDCECTSGQGGPPTCNWTRTTTTCCGSQTCGPTQLCVHLTCGGGPQGYCNLLDDAGGCPAGSQYESTCPHPGVASGPGCVPTCVTPAPSCQDVPAACAGSSPECTCLANVCGSSQQCITVQGPDVTCGAE